MKFTAIILLSACLTASAKGYSQKVSLSGKNVPLEKMFSAIETQTNYVFFYNYELLNDAKAVSIDVKNISLQNALQLLFKDQPLDFVIKQQTIFITKKNSKIIEKEELRLPPPIDIKGRVTNENGESVVATVLVKGTNNSTTANNDGYFELKGVDDNAILVISGVSIETQEIKVNGKTAFAITVKIKAAEGEDVILNAGYYKIKDKERTGNISRVDAKTIEKQPVSNPLQALQGRVPGLYIQQQSGVPGANLKVTIRGRSSIANGTDPLYLIDGVPFISNGLSTTVTSAGIFGTLGYSPLNTIDPSAIESIEVLKDADATAIYGSRGANGVILITTKRGSSQAEKIQVDINLNRGMSKVSRYLDMLSTSEYLDMRKEAFEKDNIVPSNFDGPDLLGWDQNRNTNWQKKLIGGTAEFTNAQVSVSGGNSLTQFMFSNAYEYQTTVFPGDLSTDRFSSRLSLISTSADKRFKANFSINYSTNKNNLINKDYSLLSLRLAPNAPELFTPDGKLNWANSTWENPLSELEATFKAKTSNFISAVSLSYSLLQNLEIKTNFGFNDIRTDDIKKVPSTYYDPIYGVTPQSSATNFNNTSFKSWILEPQLSWSRELKNGKVVALVGLSFQEQLNKQLVISGTGFASNDLMENIRAASTVRVIADVNALYRYNALFGRLGYTFKEKYIINATVRRDGSSRFGPGKQFGNFGALGLAWLFSKEKFFEENMTFLSYGKLRASYGNSGNDQIGDYRYLESYQASGAPYLGIIGLSPARLYNPDYSWEVNKKLEFGMELGFFRDRVLFNISYYQNRSSNQLVNSPLAMTTGFNGILANLNALVENKGLEMELNTVNFTSKTFSWKSSFNISIPKNKLLSFPGLAGSSYVNQYVVGEPLTISKRYTYTGVDPQSGLHSFTDMNGDGLLTSADRLAVKNITQKYYGGINNSLSYKKVSLDFFFQFVKQTGHSYWGSVQTFPGFMTNQPSALLHNRWTKPGDNGKNVQILTTGFNSQAVTAFFDRYTESDATITDASFIRLKNLSLSYTLLNPSKKLNYRFYVQGQNLITITNYFGTDPESYTAGKLPSLRTIVFGVQIKF